jgi:hypothetical protein
MVWWSQGTCFFTSGGRSAVLRGKGVYVLLGIGSSFFGSVQGLCFLWAFREPWRSRDPHRRSR